MTCVAVGAGTRAEAPATAATGSADAPANVSVLLRDASALHAWLDHRSSEVAAARAQVAQAQADSRSARLLQNPVADFSVSNLSIGRSSGYTSGQSSPGQTLIFGVGVSETVELGKIGPRGEAADLHAAAAGRRVNATLGDDVVDAREALGRVVYAGAREHALDESLQAAQGTADVAKGRLDHQALSGVDYDRILIDLSNLQADVMRSRAETQAAHEACSAALFAPCDESSASVSDLDVAVALPGALSGREIEGRADVAAFRLEHDAATREAVLARHRAIPDLTFRLGYTHDQFTRSGDLGNTVGLSVALPLAFFDHGQHDAAKALAHADEMDQLAHATLLRARGEIGELLVRKRAVELTLQSIEGSTLPLANGVLSAQEKGLNEGQLDITDLLLARRQAITLKMQALDLRFELFNIKNELRHALGLDAALAQR